MAKLIRGVNDLATVNPGLAKEWNSEKNDGLMPTDVTAGSGKKVWWLGKCGHEWDAKVVDRHAKHFGCPYCSGQRLLSGFNDLKTVHPELTKEWHPTKYLDVQPDMISHGSDRKVWWLGKCGHEWEATIYNRTKGSGCPYCAGQKVLKGFNDLLTVNPMLAAQWHPSKNGDITPEMITEHSSREKYWWKCEKGHEWQATVAHRHVAGCPICGNKQVLRGFNDLATTHPVLANEWHPTKNGKLTPFDVTYGSQRKVWWLGECGHEWKAEISDRSTGKGCPICHQENSTSFAEQAIFFYVRQYFDDAVNRDVSLGKELDVYIPSRKVAIEYDGRRFHTDVNKDILKNRWCEDHGIRLLRVREKECPNIAVSDVIVRCQNIDVSLNESIQQVLILLGITEDADVDVSRDRSIVLNMFIRSRKEMSLAVWCPELIKEWHPTKNGDLKPNMFAPRSNKMVWWKCHICGHEWQAVIANRSKGVGCPICARQRIRRASCKAVPQFYTIRATVNDKMMTALCRRYRSGKVGLGDSKM